MHFREDAAVHTLPLEWYVCSLELDWLWVLLLESFTVNLIMSKWWGLGPPSVTDPWRACPLAYQAQKLLKDCGPFEIHSSNLCLVVLSWDPSEGPWHWGLYHLFNKSPLSFNLMPRPKTKPDSVSCGSLKNHLLFIEVKQRWLFTRGWLIFRGDRNLAVGTRIVQEVERTDLFCCHSINFSMLFCSIWSQIISNVSIVSHNTKELHRLSSFWR